MNLKREAVKSESHIGKWYFSIYDKNAELLEEAEDRLRAMETGSSVGGKVMTWNDYCDSCPCYEDGYGSGFWITIDEVEEFKAAWKIAKKAK